jgi:hypothetical protein
VLRGDVDAAVVQAELLNSGGLGLCHDIHNSPPFSDNASAATPESARGLLRAGSGSLAKFAAMRRSSIAVIDIFCCPCPPVL